MQASRSETLIIKNSSALCGSLSVPGDKSISHRLLLFGALATGKSVFQGLSNGADVLSSAQVLRQMGVEIRLDREQTEVFGVGLYGLRAPELPLDCGNSGTTLRLLMGVLAGQSFSSCLIGDSSLTERPMDRVASPLQSMGARIDLREGRFAPVSIQAATLKGVDYHLPVASAQVKTALLLAGLYADGPTQLSGQLASRDHTERLLPAFGVHLQIRDSQLIIQSGQTLQAAQVTVPGDPSSAAFWLCAAALIPGSQVRVEQVSLNPSRIGFFEALKKMGADIDWETQAHAPEPWGSVSLNYAPLNSLQLSAAEIPFLVDEVPLLALLATQASGISEIRGAKELRVKESDRLAVMTSNLKALGVSLTEYRDGFSIPGSQSLTGGLWQAHDDHRIAMTGVLAGLIASGETQIQGAESIAVSYPDFMRDLEKLQQSSTAKH